MKQTAVEWLEQRIRAELTYEQDVLFEELFDQAKEMFEKQVIEAHLDGQTTWDVTSKTAEQYYNETYKQE